LYKEDFYNYGVLEKGETLSVYTLFEANADIFGYFACADRLANTLEYYELSETSDENQSRYRREGYY